MEEKSIRAKFDKHTITVYQAYNKNIANSAVEKQTFISPHFKQSRMTWIKPSFLWMMYRSGFATKNNQEHILAIKISREGWEWALQNACISSFDSQIYKTTSDWKNAINENPVRIQWDPERDIFLNRLKYRTIQVGLTGIAVGKYVHEWITEIEDITSLCRRVHVAILENRIEQAISLLPEEDIYCPLLKTKKEE